MSIVKLSMRRIFLVLFSFCFIAINAQTDSSFVAFLKIFPKTKLPITVDYPDSILTHEDLTLELNADPDSGRVIAVDGLYEIDDSLLIPELLVKKYILQDTAHLDSIDGHNERIAYRFYPLNNFVVNKSFIAVIYEERYKYDDYDYSEKYLMTLDKKGKMISKILIASFGHSGSSIYDDNDGDPDTYMRVPFFRIVTGSIDKKGGIHLDCQSSSILESNFVLQPNGIVEKIKTGNDH